MGLSLKPTMVTLWLGCDWDRYHPDCSDMSGRAFDKFGRSVDRFDKPDSGSLARSRPCYPKRDFFRSSAILQLHFLESPSYTRAHSVSLLLLRTIQPITLSSLLHTANLGHFRVPIAIQGSENILVRVFWCTSVSLLPTSSLNPHPWAICKRQVSV